MIPNVVHRNRKPRSNDTQQGSASGACRQLAWETDSAINSDIGGLFSGQTDREPAAEGLEMRQKEFRVTAATAEPHPIEGAVEQRAHLVQIAGGSDEL